MGGSGAEGHTQGGGGLGCGGGAGVPQRERRLVQTRHLRRRRRRSRLCRLGPHRDGAQGAGRRVARLAGCRRSYGHAQQRTRYFVICRHLAMLRKSIWYNTSNDKHQLHADCWKNSAGPTKQVQGARTRVIPPMTGLTHRREPNRGSEHRRHACMCAHMTVQRNAISWHGELLVWTPVGDACSKGSPAHRWLLAGASEK